MALHWLLNAFSHYASITYHNAYELRAHGPAALQGFGSREYLWKQKCYFISRPYLHFILQLFKKMYVYLKKIFFNNDGLSESHILISRLVTFSRHCTWHYFVVYSHNQLWTHFSVLVLKYFTIYKTEFSIIKEIINRRHFCQNYHNSWNTYR